LHGEEATHTNPSCLPAELALIYMFSPACSGGVSLMAMTWRGSAVLLLAAVCTAVSPEALQSALAEVARSKSAEYNCSVSIAVRTPAGAAQAADGIVNFEASQKAAATDLYPWGSVTKMFTAASVMKLVAGGYFRLDDEIAPLVDSVLAKMAAKDPKQNFTSIEELWGVNAAKTTLRELLGMMSTIPDFDTAQPAKTGISKDPLRAELYRQADHFYEPAELMSVPWVAGHTKECSSHMIFGKFCYSSTNFMLLGLALAQHAGVEHWSELNQTKFLPEYLQGQIRFANKGTPKDIGAVPGYDRTSYNRQPGNLSNHNNWQVDGVFAGWTASNVVATSAQIADLAWEIWGPPSSVAPKELTDQMIPQRMHIYGLGAFNVGLFSAGQSGKLGVGYGHLGATYGYQSIVGFFPELNISIALATNIETDKQVQTPDALCFSYNAVAGLILNKTFHCTFKTMGYYGGQCKCSEQVQVFV